MNVLSLFDGMACGRLALDRAGIKIDNYFASEIEKAPIKVALKNYPDIIEIGDITKIKFENGYLVTPQKIYYVGKIDLLIGGSPCQSLSFAGKQEGLLTENNIEIFNLKDYLGFKKENIKFQGQSYLFWEYVRILEEVKISNPNIKFLLENVNMKDKWKCTFDSTLGVEGKMINSSLVSAGLRSRYYWTNIKFEIPDNKNILLKDILESGKVDRDKSLCITKRYVGYQGSQGMMRYRYFAKSMGQAVFEGNASIEEHKDLYNKVGKDYSLDNNVIDGTIRSLSPLECERVMTVTEGYTIADGVNSNDRKEMLGNGWTVDVIVQIFKGLKNE